MSRTVSLYGGPQGLLSQYQSRWRAQSPSRLIVEASYMSIWCTLKRMGALFQVQWHIVNDKWSSCSLVPRLLNVTTLRTWGNEARVPVRSSSIFMWRFLPPNEGTI